MKSYSSTMNRPIIPASAWLTTWQWNNQTAGLSGLITNDSSVPCTRGNVWDVIVDPILFELYFHVDGMNVSDPLGL